MNIKAVRLQKLANKIFTAMGCNPNEANKISEHLVDANLLGHDSHGIGMIPSYVRSFHSGILFPNVRPSLVKDIGSILIFDGERGFGQSVAEYAMEKAIERCYQTGLTLVTIRNSGHMGRIGAYGEQSAKNGLISIHFVNVVDTTPSVAPHGGKEARFGTNPICMSMPRISDLEPIILDFATSRVAVGKIRVALNKKENLPEGWVIDHSGQPSRNPRVMEQHLSPNSKSNFPEGAVLPMGEHKGFGLSFFCEILAGIISGGNTIHPKNPRLGGIVNNMVTILIDPKKLVNQNTFNNELEDLITYVQSSTMIKKDHMVLLPGDLELIRKRNRTSKGIEIDEETYEQLIKAGESLKILRHELTN